MLEYLFTRFIEDHKSDFFKLSTKALDALEAAIRAHLPADDAGEWLEDAITGYGYEAEKAAFYMGFAKGACFMGEAAAISKELSI